MINLNTRQLEVVNDLDNNIIVLASAGTGKTATLTKRVVNIIDSKSASPSEILCISFTNKACKEMDERIKQEVGSASKNITVTTFHGWCYDLIRQEAKKQTDIFTDFIIFDEDDCKEVIRKVKLLLPEFNDKTFKIDKLQRFINLVKEEFARLKTFKVEDKSLDEIIKNVFETKVDEMDYICKDGYKKNEKLEEALKYRGVDLVNTYIEILESNRGVDFNDLILKTLDVLKDKQVIKGLQSTYKYINIDEVQDTSVVEYYIIEKIFGQNKVLLCGDVFQTIYQWRGSAPNAIINHFRETYKAKDIVFNVNYRATQNLANLSLGYLHNAFPERTKSIYKNKFEIKSPLKGEKTIFKQTNNIKDEAKYIYEEIKKNLESLEDICILTRDNFYNKDLSTAMEKLQSKEDTFEFTLMDEFRFFRREEVKDVMAFMKLIVNKYDAISLARIIKGFPLGISKKVLDEIESKDFKEVGISLTDFIDPVTRHLQDPYQLLINELSKENVIVFDVETTGVEPTEDEIIQIAAIKIDKDGKEISRFIKFIKNSKKVGNSELIHGFTDEFLKNNGEDKESVLKEFIKFSDGSVIVGHNVSFDISILKSELNRLGLEKPNFKSSYDTLEIYRRFYPKEKNHKLEYLSNRFKTKHKPTHDALDDILATAELLIKAVNDQITPTSFERKLKITKYIDQFEDISEKLEELFDQAKVLRPAKIVQTIVLNFNINNTYSDERVENLRNFYFLINEIANKDKNNKDSLLEVLKVTGLSNGEVELLMLRGRKRLKIPIITVHQAKGLEFDTVFLAGAQENRFPSYRSVQEKNLEEEMRTFYVAITRAKKKLYITSNSQGRFGKDNEKSRFIKLLPDEYININT